MREGQAAADGGVVGKIEETFAYGEAQTQSGRSRLPDRQALTGILFVARRGTAWEMLPAELGCGSGMTCWRRLRD